MSAHDFDSTVRRLSEPFVFAVSNFLCGLTVKGLDSVPRSGPLIVAFNHAGLIDGPLVGAVIAPARRPCFLAKKELFGPPLGGFLRRLGLIPLDRGAADHTAMRAALEMLEAGGAIGISPEGTRVKPGEVRRPKLGVSFLAAKTGAMVQPVRLLGTAAFPRAALEVRFGAPLPPPDGDGREAASAFARSVMEAIYAL